MVARNIAKTSRYTALVVVIIVVLIVVAVVTAFTCRRAATLYGNPSASVARCTDHEVAVEDLWRRAQNGDIVVQSSVPWWGEWSRYVMGSDFTHAGVLWFDDSGEPFIADVVLNENTHD